MRLTCPRCAAQYEIPDSVIPVMGREVECSACAHVWHQPGPGAGENAGNPDIPAPVAGVAGAPEFDPADRPSLNRPLDDSILSILREEAARELTARDAETRGGKAPDHIPAMADDDVPDAAGPGPRAPGPQPSDRASGAEASRRPPAEAAIEWPVATVILPGEPLTAAQLAQPAQEPAQKPAQEPVAVQNTPPHPAAPEAPAKTAPAAAASRPARPDAAATSPPAADPAPHQPPEPVASITEPEAETQTEAAAPNTPSQDQPEPDALVLPDAALLAATLTRALPRTPAAIAQQPASASVTPPFAQVPAVIPPRRGGYAMGWGVAAMLALALLAFYALAPRIQPGSQMGVVSEWRQDIDRGRLWLHDRATALRQRIAGN